MIILALTPNKNGQIQANYIVRFLGAKLINGVPTAWVVQDKVNKEGILFTMDIKRNDESIDFETLRYYTTTLADDEVTYHLFEKPQKVEKAPGFVGV